MRQAIRNHQRQRRVGEDGFTLIELLVVIIILGILAAVVVFAVGGVNDRGKIASYAIDARTIRTAEEAFCAQFGRYAEAEELVTGGFLSELPTYHRVGTGFAENPEQGCRGTGDLSKAAYFVTCDASVEGCGGGGALRMEWTEQDSSITEGLHDVACVGVKNCWAVWGSFFAPGGGIISTTDGGATPWVVDSLPSPTPGNVLDNLFAIDCVAGNKCWAVGFGPRILHNGGPGGSWVDQVAPDPMVPGQEPPFFLLTDVDFVDTLNGWAVGACGLILHTADGGVTWQMQRPAITGDCNRPLLQAVEFVDTQRGWAVGPFSSPPPFGNVITTTDGGNTWNDEEGIESNIMDIAFVSPSRGWAEGIGGGGRTSWSTEDAGVSWSRTPAAPSDRHAVDFVDARNGWRAGIAPSGSSTMESTTDGALTWTGVETPTPNGLEGLDMVDIAHGWAVGAGGAVFRYAPEAP